MRKILILTQPRDLHAYTVATAVRRLGGQAIVWHTADFPTESRQSLKFGKKETRLLVHGQDFSLEDPDFEVVWNRRPTYWIDPSQLHPADRDHAELSTKIFHRSLMGLLCPNALWVNPHDAVRKNTKILQISMARKLGFCIPETLFSNDPAEIRQFISDHGGQTIFKPLKALPWRSEDAVHVPYTSAVEESDLVEDTVLQQVPGIYQELLPKRHELRVTVIDDQVFPAKIHSQTTQKGILDWRQAYDELAMEPTSLPVDLADKCRELLKKLGFVFGCFDFVVTPDNRIVFLEVNQMGQFLFVERYTGLPLLGAFARFLLGPPQDWAKPSTVRIRYEDLREAAVAWLTAEAEQHVNPPPEMYPDADPL